MKMEIKIWMKATHMIYLLENDAIQFSSFLILWVLVSQENWSTHIFNFHYPKNGSQKHKYIHGLSIPEIAGAAFVAT